MKIEHQRKIPVPLLLAGGAVILVAGIFGFSAIANAAPTGQSGQPAKSPGPTSPDDTALANKASAVFSASLAAGSAGLIAFTDGAATPYVGAISTTVGTAWGALSTKDKANIWRGKVK